MPEKNFIVEKLKSKAKIQVTGIQGGLIHWSIMSQDLPYREVNSQTFPKATLVAQAYFFKRRVVDSALSEGKLGTRTNGIEDAGMR